jgi:hypothetical protein
MDGINGVSTSYSSFMPDRCGAKTIIQRMAYTFSVSRSRLASALKICDSIIVCASHNNWAEPLDSALGRRSVDPDDAIKASKTGLFPPTFTGMSIASIDC